MAPTSTNGKICYIEMPAVNAEHSADFYAKSFGWTIRTRGDGARAFDDTTGAVSGAFVLGRQPWAAPGILFYIMVDNVADACRIVEKHGGTIVQPLGADAPEITARFRDPGGNIVGLYEEPPQREPA
jgi:predicted enzyme related to lactoylglutathione lyase